jgi:LacI family transcriptional regulator
MAYTIKDVAALAELSIATVSRILNGKPNVKPSTRQKVIQIMKELNYFPNQIAKSMKTKRTNLIGLVVADITNPFYSDTAKLIERRAREHDYTVIVCNTDNRTSVQNAIIHTLKQKHVDGFIFGSVSMRDRAVIELIQEGYPCIMYHRHLQGYMGHFIGCDNNEGIRMAMGHLYELGHRRIGFISGPRIFSTGMERLSVYLTVSKELNLMVPSYFIKEGGYERSKTKRCLEELLALPDPPTAIIVANDLMALQVLDGILSAGFKVPDDFSVVGFDNISMASHQSIQLTTIDAQAERCARLAIDNLLNLIENVRTKSDRIKILLKPSLQKRNTTSSPKQMRNASTSASLIDS